MSTLEIRIYIWTVLLLFVILVFGILRLYNAVVTNSRYLNIMRNGLAKYIADLKRMTTTLDTTIQQNSNRMSGVTKIAQSLQHITDAMRQLFINDNREDKTGG